MFDLGTNTTSNNFAINATSLSLDVINIRCLENVTLSEVLEKLNPNNELFRNNREPKLYINAFKNPTVFTLNEIKLIAEKTREILKYFDKITVAITLDNPLQTALSIAYKQKITCEKLQLNIFSTSEAAIEWINNKE